MSRLLERLKLRSLNWPERIIVYALLVIGIASLFAFPAMLLPFRWMDEIHRLLGMGELPDTPVVRYLARSLSLFYGIFGILSLALARDIRKYREVVQVWATTLLVHGVALLVIDLEAGLPILWTLNEGPPAVAAAIILIACSRRIETSSAFATNHSDNADATSVR